MRDTGNRSNCTFTPAFSNDRARPRAAAAASCGVVGAGHPVGPAFAMGDFPVSRSASPTIICTGSAPLPQDRTRRRLLLQVRTPTTIRAWDEQRHEPGAPIVAAHNCALQDGEAMRECPPPEKPKIANLLQSAGIFAAPPRPSRAAPCRSGYHLGMYL